MVKFADDTYGTYLIIPTADRNRIGVFLREAHKFGFCADISFETIMDRFDAADDAFS